MRPSTLFILGLAISFAPLLAVQAARVAAVSAGARGDAFPLPAAILELDSSALQPRTRDRPGDCDQANRTERRRCIAQQVVHDSLTPDYVQELVTRYFAPNATFVDPSGTYTGAQDIITYLTQLGQLIHMDSSRVEALANEDDVWIAAWHQQTHLVAKIDGKPSPAGELIDIHGSTMLEFDQDDKVTCDRDTLDRFLFYQQIPGFNATAQKLLTDYIAQLSH